MNDWTPGLVKQVVDDAVKAERAHRDTLRADDKEALREKFESLDRALRLQAASYPTIGDFNDLKTKVESLVTMIKVISGLVVLAGVIATILTYTSSLPK